jgi:hypothetical protein
MIFYGVSASNDRPELRPQGGQIKALPDAGAGVTRHSPWEKWWVAMRVAIALK